MYTEVLVGSTREYWALTHNYDVLYSAQQTENIFGLKWMQHCDGVYSHEPKMMSVWWISYSGKLGCWAAFLLSCWASCLRFLWCRSWGFYILNFSFICKKNQQFIFHPELNSISFCLGSGSVLFKIYFLVLSTIQYNLFRHLSQTG